MSAHTRKTMLLATDQQQSVLNTLDENGPRSIAYTPYGHRSPENGLLSLLGFNGEPPDALTGHYHLGNGYRQFNPVLMRFNSPDSWSPFGDGGLNAYAYCLGDPVNMTDFTGHTPTLIKYIFRKLGIMNVPRIKSSTPKPVGIMKVPHSTPSEQQSSDLMKNMTNNLNNEYMANNLTQKRYNELFKLNKVRNRNYSGLLADPEYHAGIGAYTKLPSGKHIPTRNYYSDLTLSDVSKTPAPPIPEKAFTLTFSEQAEVLEFERIVPRPSKGWRKVANIRQTSK